MELSFSSSSVSEQVGDGRFIVVVTTSVVDTRIVLLDLRFRALLWVALFCPIVGVVLVGVVGRIVLVSGWR